MSLFFLFVFVCLFVLFFIFLLFVCLALVLFSSEEGTFTNRKMHNNIIGTKSIFRIDSDIIAVSAKSNQRELQKDVKIVFESFEVSSTSDLSAFIHFPLLSLFL